MTAYSKESKLCCPVCDGVEVVTDVYTYEETCPDCGCVLSDTVLNDGYDYRAYTSSERWSRSRFGQGYRHSVFDRGMNTYISGRRDANGNNLPDETRSNMRRLQRRDNRSKINESDTRNLLIAMSELDRIISEVNLTVTVKEEAAVIYRRALKAKLIRGRSIDAFIAASIYAACRVLGIPRPLKDISEASKRDHGEVGRSYRKLLMDLKLRPPVDDPFKFLPNICAKLGADPWLEHDATDILRRAQKLRAISGKDPRGVAGAAIYMASQRKGVRFVQRVVAEAAGTTSVTLRNRYRGLKQAFGE